MKTINFLLVSALLLTAGLTKSIAGEYEVKNKAYTELNTELIKSLKNIVFGEVNSISDCNLLILTFSVNANHEMVNIEVSGDDSYIAQEVKKMLENRSPKVNPYFDGKTYRVPIRVVDYRR
jgi:hypothetical protein